MQPERRAARGVFDPGNGVNTGEGLGLLAERPGIWGPMPEAPSSTTGWRRASRVGRRSPTNADYQSRYLSNSGRLFFNSPDHLTSAATGTKEKVYEYEPGGVGGCTSGGGCTGLISDGESAHEAAFLDASANGNDVFFATFDRLTTQDVDGALDVYDAHVCAEGGCPPPPAAPPAPCEEQACQGTFALAPGAPPSGSATFSGPGNGDPARLGSLGVTSTTPPKPKPLTRRRSSRSRSRPAARSTGTAGTPASRAKSRRDAAMDQRDRRRRRA